MRHLTRDWGSNFMIPKRFCHVNDLPERGAVQLPTGLRVAFGQRIEHLAAQQQGSAVVVATLPG